MIKKFWEYIHFYCLNHEEPIPMTIMEGDTAFFACPHYMIKDEKHPYGREQQEKMCVNRLSFAQATKIVDKFMKIIDADGFNAVGTDYKGLKFKVSGIDVRILKYSQSDIKIGVWNRRSAK